MQPVMRWIADYVINLAWQAPVLALCTWALVRLTGRGGARLHYRLWLGCLLLCVVLPAMPRVHLPSWPMHAQKAANNAVTSEPAPTGVIQLQQIPQYVDQAVAPVHTSWIGSAIVGIYALTFLIGGIKLLRDLMVTRAVVDRSKPVELSEALSEEMFRTAKVLGLRSSVPVRASAEIRSPATASWPEAMLLVPQDFDAVPEQDAAAAIAHELVHVQRRDFYVNLGCEALTVAAFFHPAVHWVKRRVTETREVICDARAAELTAGRAAYARSLVSLAEGVAKSEL